MGFFSNPLAAIGSVVNPVSLIANVGALGGEAYSAYQQSKNVKDTNAMNQMNARESMQFSAAEADKQMAFQERMAGSAHQRQVADLKAAGLNPLLSLNSGADSPGGASGSGATSTAQAPPAMMERVLTSAKELLRLRSDLKTQERQRINLDTDTNVKDADWHNRELGGQGLKLENELMSMRNDFFKKNPWAFKLNAASGGLNSAAGLLRVFQK